MNLLKNLIALAVIAQVSGIAGTLAIAQKTQKFTAAQMNQKIATQFEKLELDNWSLRNDSQKGMSMAQIVQASAKSGALTVKSPYVDELKGSFVSQIKVLKANREALEFRLTVMDKTGQHEVTGRKFTIAMSDKNKEQNKINFERDLKGLVTDMKKSPEYASRFKMNDVADSMSSVFVGTAHAGKLASTIDALKTISYISFGLGVVTTIGGLMAEKRAIKSGTTFGLTSFGWLIAASAVLSGSTYLVSSIIDDLDG